jgi:hypothetical protein
MALDLIRNLQRLQLWLLYFSHRLSGVIPKARARQVLYRDAFAISGIGLITNFGFASIARHIPDAFITTGLLDSLLLCRFFNAP